MNKIKNIDQTPYQILLDHCISDNNVSKIYLAAHREKPLIHPKIKIKVIDISKYPSSQKERYPKFVKKILLHHIRPFYQNLYQRFQLPDNFFKAYRAIDENTNNQKDVFYVLNQYHKGEQLRRCVLNNNVHLQNPMNIKKFGKYLLWNVIKADGIQGSFLYTSTNVILDDKRFQININSISTAGLLFIQSVIDSRRIIQKAQKKQLEIQKKLKLQKTIIENQQNTREKQKNIKTLEDEIKPWLKIIQDQKTYLETKQMHKEQFLQVFPYMNDQVLQLPKSDEQKAQNFIKQKMGNFAALYLMMISRKDLSFKDMQCFKQKKPIGLKELINKLKDMGKNYQQFLSRPIVKQRIQFYEQKLSLKKQSLLNFFTDVLVDNDFSKLEWKQNQSNWICNTFDKNKKQKVFSWRKVYQICGFLQNTDNQLQERLFKMMHRTTFQFQSNKQKYLQKGTADPLFYLPIKLNLNFMQLTAGYRHWYSCFQSEQFSKHTIFGVLRIKQLLCRRKETLLDGIPENMKLEITGIKTRYFHTLSEVTSTQKSRIEAQLAKTTKTLQYLKIYETKFFLKKEERNIVINQNFQPITFYLPTQTYMSNYCYLWI